MIHLVGKTWSGGNNDKNTVMLSLVFTPEHLFRFHNNEQNKV